MPLARASGDPRDRGVDPARHPGPLGRPDRRQRGRDHPGGRDQVTDAASFTLSRDEASSPERAGEAPKRGCSEIHLGRLKDGRHFLGTIEPWHGTRGSRLAGKRDRLAQVRPAHGHRLDTLADGHALWVADVDGDGDDELFAGHRGKDHRVSMYDFDRRTEMEPDRARQRHRRPGPARRRP